MADYKVSFHYNGYLLNIETLPYNNDKILYDTASKMILQTLQKGVNLKNQIYTYHSVIKKIINRLKKNKYVSMFDKRLCCLGIISLIKLKDLDNDDKNGFLILKNKSRIKILDPNWIKLIN
jgi:hypothetical protein